MKSKKKLFIFITISLALVFTLIYCIADRYMMNNKNMKIDNTAIAAQNTEKAVADDIKISLISNDNSNEELSLKERFRVLLVNLNSSYLTDLFLNNSNYSVS